MVAANQAGPMTVVVVPDGLLDQLPAIMPQIEDEFRLRKDYHFRSILAYKGSAEQVCSIAINQVLFSSCVIIDGYLQKSNIENLIEEMKPEALKKTPFFVIATDKGNYYEGNGNLHMIFRDKEIKHEYRVVEGIGGVEDLGIGGLEEIIMFVAENFHR